MTDPITIESDTEFSEAGFIGLGTETNPYILENANITISNLEGLSHAIKISDTEAPFVIRNCHFRGIFEENSEGDDLVDGILIHLLNADNGEIYNNVFENFHVGISMFYCRCITISGNNFTQSEKVSRPIGTGIFSQYGGSNHTVIGNSITTTRVALHFISSSYNVIKNNELFYNEESILVDHYSNFNYIERNQVNRTAKGIAILNSVENYLSYNTVDYGAWTGISVSGDDNHLTCNSVIHFSSTHSDLIDFGWGMDEDAIGLYLTGSSNYIHWNNFIENEINVKCDGAHNLFIFNYYSDYAGVDADEDGFGDANHTIIGQYPNVDMSPRVVLDFILPPSSPIFPIVFVFGVISTITIFAVIVIFCKRKGQPHRLKHLESSIEIENGGSFS